MKISIARPTLERFDQIIDYLNWLSESLEALDNDYTMDAETFISDLRCKSGAIDHKIRHVVLACETLIDNLCDTGSAVLETRQDIAEHLKQSEKADG